MTESDPIASAKVAGLVPSDSGGSPGLAESARCCSEGSSLHLPEALSKYSSIICFLRDSR